MVLVAALVLGLSQDPASPDPLKRLAFLEGKWESTEKTQVQGKEVTFKLQGSNTWILLGTCLQIDESFEVAGIGKMANHILMTYDAPAKTYRAAWYSSQSPVPTSFSGNWTGNDLVLTDAADRVRIAYHPIEKGRYDAELLVKTGEKWIARTKAEYRQVATQTK